MKKIVIVTVFALMMCFLYFYQSPIISTNAAIQKAEEYLLNPPEEWKKSISFDGSEEHLAENISVNLTQKHGFWNELFNRMQWEVTIKYPQSQPTIIMDAHTGEFIGLSGPFN